MLYTYISVHRIMYLVNKNDKPPTVFWIIINFVVFA